MSDQVSPLLSEEQSRDSLLSMARLVVEGLQKMEETAEEETETAVNTKAEAEEGEGVEGGRR